MNYHCGGVYIILARSIEFKLSKIEMEGKWNVKHVTQN